MADETVVGANGVKATEAGSQYVIEADPDLVTVDAGAAGGKLRAVAIVVVKTANYVLQASDYGKIFSNAGATGPVTLTLPAAVALPASGIPFRLRMRVSAAHLFTLQTTGIHDLISQGAGVSAENGKIESAVPGAQLEIMNDELNKWVAAPLGPTNWSLT